MQCSVAESPKVSISAHEIQIPSLLDYDSEVMLLRQSYFEQHILTKIKLVMSEKADTHKLFILIVTNDGKLLIGMYTKHDITCLGLKVPNFGMLIIDDPSQMFDKKHQSKLPGMVGKNLVWPSYKVFVRKYWTSGFNFFTYLEGVNPLLFSQSCVCHHSDTCESSVLGISSKTVLQQSE